MSFDLQPLNQLKSLDKIQVLWSHRGFPPAPAPWQNSAVTDAEQSDDASADGGWAWLGALLDSPARTQALRHALIGLGFSQHQLLRGLASQLGVTTEGLERPDPAALAACRRDRVGTVIPILLEHPDARLVAVGRRWLTAAGMLYEIDPSHVERWLTDDGDIARLLAPSIAREGLALLGPTALRRLATSAPPATRALAADWVRRLGGRHGQ